MTPLQREEVIDCANATLFCMTAYQAALSCATELWSYVSTAQPDTMHALL